MTHFNAAGHPIADQEFAKIKVNGVIRFMQIVSLTDDRLVGFRVTKTGNKWDHSKMVDGVLHVTEEVFVLDPSNLVERLQLNMFYGELEPLDP